MHNFVLKESMGTESVTVYVYKCSICGTEMSCELEYKETVVENFNTFIPCNEVVIQSIIE